MLNMFAIIAVIISISLSSMAERNANNSYPHQGFSFENLIPNILTNASDASVYYKAIPPELYYEEPSNPKPSDDIRSKFNVSGLTPEEVRIVLAFPVFESNDVKNHK